jgi:hypothetical protein
MVLAIINKLLKKFPSVLHLLLYKLSNFHKNHVLTRESPLKETVLGVFDLAEIVAGGSKNLEVDGFCAKFFAKSNGENRNR